jgi:hypothetical protein
LTDRPKKNGRPKLSDEQRKLNQRLSGKRTWQAVKLNPSRLSVYRATQRRKRIKRKQDPHWIVRMAAARRISDAMRRWNTTKSARTAELCGCTFGELRTHIEKQFKRGMTWQNYGTLWHIDHIIPCAAFDLSRKEEQARCFNYLNLRPLEAATNRSKGSRIEMAQIPLGIYAPVYESSHQPAYNVGFRTDRKSVV